MKRLADLIRGWIQKARSDMIALNASLQAGALDAACFHAQQAVEKYLKAYLTLKKVEYPFTHNLSKLLALCEKKDILFAQLESIVEPLTPYAVELRYDAEFWPTLQDAIDAQSAAGKAEGFILSKMPKKYSE